MEILLADAELQADLADDAAQVVAGRRGSLFAFRLGERATWRLLATRPADADQLPFGQPGPPVPAAELQALMDEAGLDARITDLAWSSRVRVQHRVADRFGRGLFLAGVSAHAYSPATGQGMNAALQDAANLGWKLAFAAARPGARAAARLLRPRAPRPAACSGTGDDAPGVLGRSLHRRYPVELLRGTPGAARRPPRARADRSPPPGRARRIRAACRSCG